MAISKERLEELILKGVKIYDSWHGNEFCVRDIEKIEDDVVTYSFLLDEYQTTLEDLHEDYEYFKWYEEFGCIERVERLKLPTWEEFKNDGEFSFLDKQGFEWDLYSPDDETRISLVGGYDHFEYEYTKENYTLACRKAKELFLKGETNNERTRT